MWVLKILVEILMTCQKKRPANPGVLECKSEEPVPAKKQFWTGNIACAVWGERVYRRAVWYITTHTSHARGQLLLSIDQ